MALLVERGDAARLAPRRGGGKALAKRARALHVLRTRGVAAPKAEKREFRLHGPYAPAEELSLASMIDGRGERVVWLVRAADKGLRRLRGAAVGDARHPRLHDGERAAQGLARRT